MNTYLAITKCIITIHQTPSSLMYYFIILCVLTYQSFILEYYNEIWLHVCL